MKASSYSVGEGDKVEEVDLDRRAGILRRTAREIDQFSDSVVLYREA